MGDFTWRVDVGCVVFRRTCADRGSAFVERERERARERESEIQRERGNERAREREAKSIFKSRLS